MQITFTGHHLDVTDALRDFTQATIEPAQRHFDRITSINVTFTVEKLRHIAEATLHVPGTTLHASSESTEDMYAAIDSLVDKLDRQVKKHKEKEQH